jgi:Fe-S cluster assembly protein SufD
MTISANAPAITEATIRALSERHGEPAWLLEKRLEALRAYEAMSMPNPLEEEWRRTDLSRIDFDAALAATGEGAAELRAESLPAGIVFSDLQMAAREHEALVRQHLHSLVHPTEWKLAALQAAAWADGAFVYVPRGVEATLPLSYLTRQAGAPLFPHLLIVAEANSSVTVVQESTGQAPAGWSLVSGAVEIVAMQDARVRFVDVQNLGADGAVSFQTMRARLERGAELNAALIGLGGLLSKTKLEVTLAGEGSRAELLGLSFGNGKQHFDYVTLQDHIAPRTSSDLMFKAALDGEASEVWTGTVRIHKGAGQSDANQTSRNLLLSEHAKAAPIPVLEIEAYDVLRCSHGATAGPLDEDQRFYLESRGIPPAEAQQLLVEAFFREVIDRLPEPVDRERIEQIVLSKIGSRG